MSTLMQTANGGYEVQMTMDEWKKTHKDFKSRIDGMRTVLYCLPSGTSIVPVRIIKETV